MAGWIGNNNFAAFKTSNGYLLMDRCRYGIDYTIMANDYTKMQAGFLEQPKAEINAAAKLIADGYGIEVLNREIYDDVLQNYVAKNL